MPGRESSLREAKRLWWLTEEELDHYGLRGHDRSCGDYLSLAAFHKVVVPQLQEASYPAVVDNKWLFGTYFSQMGVATPHVFGLLHPTQGLLRDGTALRSGRDLIRWALNQDRTRLVVKPVSGGNSRGVFLIEEITGGAKPLLRCVGRPPMTVSEFENQLLMELRGDVGCIVQEYPTPHSWWASAGIGPLNVARVVTFVEQGGGIEIQSAVLFSGRDGHYANRWTEGALSIAIDRETGRLGSARTLPKFGSEWIDVHPDTQVRFAGEILPDWPAARDLCTRAASVSPGMRLVCWEVLLTESGPQILEGNLRFGLTMLQVHTQGFLAAGEIAESWQAAGATPPDGTLKWVRRHAPSLPTRAARRVSMGMRARLQGRLLGR